MDSTFQAACEAAADAWQVPALAAAMEVGGAVTTACVGCAPETRFRIASVTKPTVAALALRLLDLDAPTAIWPEEVRVRHLLAHASGFDCELAGGDYERFGDDDDALARCVAELPSVRRFVGVDELWSYANTGYWLTGLAAAERFGGTFEDALHATVLAPAGLDATDFGEPDVPGHAVEPPPVAYPRARRPSGGLTSTVADLLRLGRWHLAQPWLEPARTVRAKPVGGVYGLGLFGERVGGEDVWGHSGSWGGFQSSWLTIPSRGAVFAGLTNHELGGKAVKQVEDVFFRAAVGEPRRRPQHVSLQPEQYDAFTGRYENTDGSYVVRREPGQDGLTLEAWDEVLEARAIGERTFAVAAGNHVDERFDFPREGFGRFGSRLAARTA